MERTTRTLLSLRSDENPSKGILIGNQSSPISPEVPLENPTESNRNEENLDSKTNFRLDLSFFFFLLRQFEKQRNVRSGGANDDRRSDLADVSLGLQCFGNSVDRDRSRCDQRTADQIDPTLESTRRVSRKRIFSSMNTSVVGVEEVLGVAVLSQPFQLPFRGVDTGLSSSRRSSFRSNSIFQRCSTLNFSPRKKSHFPPRWRRPKTARALRRASPIAFELDGRFDRTRFADRRRRRSAEPQLATPFRLHARRWTMTLQMHRSASRTGRTFARVLDCDVVSRPPAEHRLEQRSTPRHRFPSFALADRRRNSRRRR